MAKYENYISNLSILKQSPNQDLHNEFIKSGIIDKFTMQFELAWKLLAKLLDYEGCLDVATRSPRGIIKCAFATYDFIDETLWLDMLADRNAAQHVYDAQLANTLVDNIIKLYLPEFEKLLSNIESQYTHDVLVSM